MFVRCKENFSDLKKLFKHTQSEHKKSATNKSKTDEKEHQCEFCKKYHANVQNLNRHIEDVHNVEKKSPPTIQCPLCNQPWQKLAMLDKHLLESHGMSLREGELYFDSSEGD